MRRSISSGASARPGGNAATVRAAATSRAPSARSRSSSLSVRRWPGSAAIPSCRFSTGWTAPGAISPRRRPHGSTLPRHLCPALADPPQSRRLLDRQSRGSPSRPAGRAGPRLRRRHAAHRSQARCLPQCRGQAGVTRVTIRIDFDDGRYLGHGKVRLLEMVEAHGSISSAARAMDMSYRRAWLLADEVNRMFTTPVLETQLGGKGGGHARLTEFGRLLVTHYRPSRPNRNKLSPPDRLAGGAPRRDEPWGLIGQRRPAGMLSAFGKDCWLWRSSALRRLPMAIPLRERSNVKAAPAHPLLLPRARRAPNGFSSPSFRRSCCPCSWR